MLSRRKFLQTNVAGLASPLRASPGRYEAVLVESGASSSGAEPKRDYSNDWPHYLTAKMNEARAGRKGELESIRSETETRDRIGRIRVKVWELIGGPLEKTPSQRSDRGQGRKSELSDRQGNF